MPHTYRFQIGALVGFGIMAIVSIPERVWGGLEPIPSNNYSEYADVSIPERVWGGLEPSMAAAIACCRLVSIPERVWGGLERAIEAVNRLEDLFQSLRGFGVGWSYPQ